MIVFTKEEERWLLENCLKLGKNRCAEILGRSVDSVRKKYGKMLQDGFVGTNVNPDNRFLYRGCIGGCKTPESAYILGILWADGHVPRGTNSVIYFRQNESDGREIIDVFNRTGNWKCLFRKRGKPSWKDTIELRIKDEYFGKFIHEYEYDKKSTISPDKLLEYIPLHLRQFWWRGYFDGDGHIDSKRAHVVLAGSFNQDWTFALRLFEDMKIECKVVRIQTPHGNSSTVRIVGIENCLSFGDYIYCHYSEMNSFGLMRKRNKFIDLKWRSR